MINATNVVEEDIGNTSVKKPVTVVALMIEEMEEEIMVAVEAEEWIDVMIEMAVVIEIEWVLITMVKEDLEETEEVMIEMIGMEIEVIEIMAVINTIEEMVQTDLTIEEVADLIKTDHQDLHQMVAEWLEEEEVDHDQDLEVEGVMVVIDMEMEEEDHMVKWMLVEMMTEEKQLEFREISQPELIQWTLVVAVTINLRT